MKTIKQIADEVGVSKQAIRNQIAKLGLQSSLQKNGNQFAIDEEQETAIKQSFEKISQSENTKQTQSNSQTENDSLCVVVSVLQEQLRVKDEQLAEKDKQIKDLTDTVKSQAQSINADRHNELASTLQMQLTDGEIAKPKSRWQRAWSAWKGE